MVKVVGVSDSSAFSGFCHEFETRIDDPNSPSRLHDTRVLVMWWLLYHYTKCKLLGELEVGDVDV
jgi:hypothetical protein